MVMSGFFIVDGERIRRGECTDIYFARIAGVLEAEGLDPEVVMEVSAASLPERWGVFCGLADILELLEGLPVSLDAMPEGSVFYPNEPVVRLAGRYREIARLENPLLGFICHASGIASAAAHIRLAAAGRPVYSFGSRRQHPAIAAMIERSAWIGGVDGASNTCAPEGVPLAGTMPHAFVLCYPGPADAFRSFHRHAPPDVPRIMLCDTLFDEKAESLMAAEAGCTAVRLDTPRSRRGDMRAIAEEVRWELDAHGHNDVRILLSGGLTKDDVLAYRDVADAFGIGGAIASAPVIDFSMDIVEVDGRKCAKRGRRSGAKQVYELPTGVRITLPQYAPANATANPPAHVPKDAIPLLQRFIEDGRIVQQSGMQEARERVLARLERMREQRE